MIIIVKAEKILMERAVVTAPNRRKSKMNVSLDFNESS